MADQTRRAQAPDPADPGADAGEAGGGKITTAALAAKLDVSEAALYRHFASKAQMFEGLIEFIEETMFGLVNKITTEQTSGLAQIEAILSMLLGFAKKNPGMTRVLIGDALVNENERLQARINQLHDRLEATLKQACASPPRRKRFPRDVDAAAHANLLLCLRHRPLAPVRQERLQARPDRVLGRAVEAAGAGVGWSAFRPGSSASFSVILAAR